MLYKKHPRSGKNTKVFGEFKLLQNNIVNFTNDSNNLNDSHAFRKACWSILKMFLNNKKLQLFHICSSKTGLQLI